MKLDVTQELVELDGTTIVTSGVACPACRQPVGKRQPMTVQLALTRALSFRGEREDIKFEEQMERYRLAKRISGEDVVELTISEAGKLQGLLAKVFGPVITGQVGLLLEGE